MKKLLILCLGLLTGLSAQAQLTEVKITQIGYPDDHGLRVAIGGKIHQTQESGELVYKGLLEVNGPVYGMVINSKSRYAGFWIEPGAQEVIIYKKGFPDKVEVKGSKSHAIFRSLADAEDNEAFVRAFAKAPNDTVSLRYFNQKFKFMKMETGQLRYLYEMVSDEKKPQLADLKAYIDTQGIPKVTIDRDIYDFIGQDAEGKRFNTEDYRGKYLLIDFAATGCGPCWAGYPELLTEVAKYENLQVVTFNQDHEIETWQKIADSRKLDLPWPVLWDGKNKKEVFEIYGINGWPNFFLISPEGKVLDQWMGSGGDHLAETLENFVK